MQRVIIAAVILAVTLLPAAGFSQSKLGYVSDMLLLTFREGPGASFPVSKTLKSNTPLTVLEEQESYVKVRLSSGETGWVDKQFVVYDPPKTLVIEELKKQNQTLAEKLDTMVQAQETLKGELTNKNGSNEKIISDLKADLQKVGREKESLSSKLAASQDRYKEFVAKSENVMDVINRNKALQQENQKLSKEISLLEQETGHLFKTGMIKWFLAGVGVLLLGWLIGQSVSSKKRRRSSLLD